MPAIIQLNVVIVTGDQEEEMKVARELAFDLAGAMKREEERQRCAHFHGCASVVIADHQQAAVASIMIQRQLQKGLEQGAETATMTDLAKERVDEIAAEVIRRRKERPDG